MCIFYWARCHDWLTGRLLIIYHSCAICTAQTSASAYMHGHSHAQKVFGGNSDVHHRSNRSACRKAEVHMIFMHTFSSSVAYAAAI